MLSHTRQLADFAANLSLGDVPKEVVARAKEVMLDGLGCGLYGSDLRWTQILANVVKRMEPDGGKVSIWGRRQTACAVNAALVNGTMVQGYELDDVHIGGGLHTCAVVLPAALAAAEYAGADKLDGERLLLAVIAGFEIGPRVGMCLGVENMIKNGWHGGGIIGPFPAAVSAAVVLGLNAEQIHHAFGMAGTQACGLLAAQFGSMFKRVQHGKAAQNGLYGALLAADGFTGIEDVFEQEHGGFCSAFSHSSDQYDLSALSDGLGTRWETMRFTIKPYACRGGNHSSLDAIGELAQEHHFQANDVEGITIAATEGMLKHDGWYPYVPNGLTAAQMNTGFCVAMRLIEGDVFVDQMVEENAGRPDLVALANRVRMVRSIEREQKGNDYRKGIDMEVRLKDGRVLRKTVDFPLGSDRRPLTGEHMAKKFRRMASKALPPKQVAEIEQMVWHLQERQSLKPVIATLQKQ